MNIRPEDIVEGNGKLTLGLIWTIILNFQVSVIKLRQQQEALARAAALSHSSTYNNSSTAVLRESTTSSYYQQTSADANGAASSSATSQSVVLQRQVNLSLIYNALISISKNLFCVNV